MANGLRRIFIAETPTIGVCGETVSRILSVKCQLLCLERMVIKMKSFQVWVCDNNSLKCNKNAIVKCYFYSNQ